MTFQEANYLTLGEAILACLFGAHSDLPERVLLYRKFSKKEYPLRLSPYPIPCQWIMEALEILARELGKTVEEVTAEIEAACEAIEAEAKSSPPPKMKATLAVFFFAPTSLLADSYRVHYSLRGSGREMTVQAESTAEARRLVMEIFGPRCLVTGVHRLK